MNEYGIEIDDNLMQQWQAIVDIIANIMDVPAALIMRIVGSDIEVFIANSGDDNPYNPGAREQLHGSGLYCESVISKKEKLLVPNALSDENWKNNPDIKLNMISYLGIPCVFSGW